MCIIYWGEEERDKRARPLVYRDGKQKLERTGAIRFLPPVPNGPAKETICWQYWFEHNYPPPVNLQKILGDHPSERSAFQCSKCKLIFSHPKDARGHEYGIIGDLSNDWGGHRRYLFTHPCQPSNNIIELMKTCKKGSPVYFPSRYMLQEYLKENERLYPGVECGLDRSYKELLKQYNIRESRNKHRFMVPSRLYQLRWIHFLCTTNGLLFVLELTTSRLSRRRAEIECLFLVPRIVVTDQQHFARSSILDLWICLSRKRRAFSVWQRERPELRSVK